MSALLAVVNGLLLGAVAGQYQPTGPLRRVLLVAVAGGVIATTYGQATWTDPQTLAVSLALVTVSTAVGFLSARRLTLGRHRH